MHAALPRQARPRADVTDRHGVVGHCQVLGVGQVLGLGIGVGADYPGQRRGGHGVAPVIVTAPMACS